MEVRYITPFATDKNIGREYNKVISELPEDCWIVLRDVDTCSLTPNFGRHIETVIKTHGNDFGLIGCMTNRLRRKTQLVDGMFDNHNMLDHKDKAFELEKTHYNIVEDVTSEKFIAGMFMLFPKSVWKECKFPENNIAFDDAFSILVRKKGYKLGLMKGLYVYHLYRAWSDNPLKDRKHLR